MKTPTARNKCERLQKEIEDLTIRMMTGKEALLKEKDTNRDLRTSMQQNEANYAEILHGRAQENTMKHLQIVDLENQMAMSRENMDTLREQLECAKQKLNQLTAD